jgi:hypothetical protein
VGVQCYYGWRGGHSHNDGLAFDLYAHGQALTPDTGYGDAMNSYVAGIYTWTRATIAHNTVTVDARQQPGNQGGQVLGLAFTPTVQHVDLSAPGNYPQLREYRRALLLVSTDDKNAYLVDVFRVAGGAQHDYSLHGTVGEVSVLRGQFSEPRAKGTLAGEDVAVGRIYDDPVLGAAGYAGVFHSYKGSGFQHLTAVRQQTDQGLVTVAVAARDQPQTRLHLHLLPQAGQTVFLAQAQISPVNQPDRLPYLVARRTGPGLHSVFVSVLDPYLDRPQVLAAEALPTAADAVALRLTRETGVDIVLLATSGGTERRAGEALVTDVAGAVIHLQPDGTLLAATAWGGSFVEVNGRRQVLRPDAIGEVTAVDLAGNAVAVRWRQESPAGTELTGHHLFLENHLRRNVFQVEAAAAEAGTTVLRLRASLVNGRGRITGLDEAARTVRSDSRFMFGACYRGMWLVNQAGDTFLPIAEFAGGGFVVDHAGRLEDVFGPAGTDGRREFRVAVAGPGDQVRLPRVTEW